MVELGMTEYLHVAATETRVTIKAVWRLSKMLYGSPLLGDGELTGVLGLVDDSLKFGVVRMGGFSFALSASKFLPGLECIVHGSIRNDVMRKNRNR